MRLIDTLTSGFASHAGRVATKGATRVPAQGLARLIERRRPGVSVRQIERDAGLPHERISHWLKPGTRVNRLPLPAAVREIARAVGCDEAEVVHAFNDSLDEPHRMSALPDDVELLVWRYRNLPPSERASLLAVSQTFAVQAGIEDPPGQRGAAATA